MNDIITGDDILGKDVLDKNGKQLGVVVKIHLNRHSRHLEGISIDRGLTSSDIFIGNKFISLFGEDIIKLNIIPGFSFEDCSVYIEDGRYVGKVISVEMENNLDIKSLILSKNSSLIKSKRKEILKEEVKSFGKSIFLKKN